MEKNVFISRSGVFFDTSSDYPEGAWQQHGVLFFDAGSAEGRLIWYQLDSFDPACGDDSLACDWSKPHHFVDTYGRSPYVSDDFEQIDGKALWDRMLKEGYVELEPMLSEVYLCQHDENNPFESPFYLHTNNGFGASVQDYHDFLDALARIDSWEALSSDEDQPE